MEDKKVFNIIIVAILVLLGIGLLAFGVKQDKKDATKTDDKPKTSESTNSEQSKTSNDSMSSADNQTKGTVLAIVPEAGKVQTTMQNDEYSATFREGDNQTYVVRQIVANYLNDNSKTLSNAQRLYMESSIVNSLPGKSDQVAVGQTVSVSKSTLDSTYQQASSLSPEQQSLWASYL